MEGKEGANLGGGGKADEDDHEEDGEVPEVVEGVDEGASEDGGAGVEGGGSDDADEHEDHDGEGDVLDHVVVDQHVVQTVHRLKVKLFLAERAWRGAVVRRGGAV
jgi:hypothetical protein